MEKDQTETQMRVCQQTRIVIGLAVSRNISPSMDKSCSSGLNGLDPEQMNGK